MIRIIEIKKPRFCESCGTTLHKEQYSQQQKLIHYHSTNNQTYFSSHTYCMLCSPLKQFPNKELESWIKSIGGIDKIKIDTTDYWILED